MDLRRALARCTGLVRFAGRLVVHELRVHAETQQPPPQLKLVPRCAQRASTAPSYRRPVRNLQPGLLLHMAPRGSPDTAGPDVSKCIRGAVSPPLSAETKRQETDDTSPMAHALAMPLATAASHGESGAAASACCACCAASAAAAAATFSCVLCEMREAVSLVPCGVVKC